MSSLTLFLILSILLVGLMALGTLLELKKKPTPMPKCGSLSPHETAKQMIKIVLEGGFLIHTLKSEASPSDDGVSLEGTFVFSTRVFCVFCC